MRKNIFAVIFLISAILILAQTPIPSSWKGSQKPVPQKTSEWAACVIVFDTAVKDLTETAKQAAESLDENAPSTAELCEAIMTSEMAIVKLGEKCLDQGIGLLKLGTYDNEFITKVDKELETGIGI